MSELDPTTATIQARHTPLELSEATICGRCEQCWPCDAHVLVTRLAAAQEARDDFTTGTYEMLGELLKQHQITPEPCPGGPCVANALIAISNRIKAAEQARDQALNSRDYWHKFALRTADRAGAAEARLTRLAALETAARAWEHHRAIARDPQTEPAVWWANTTLLVQAERALADAVRALDPAAGEAG